ncbi:MAG: OB-fold nucleic acid binding domain-containing protein [Marinilabiliaceae bacterium]|nr:OB-fold nucleic acid binding domain-containing protein [Marinilabiliaceae bacterium]
MKKITYYLGIALIFAACNSTQKKSDQTAEAGCDSKNEAKTEACCSKDAKTTEATVDAIFSTPDKFVDKTVSLKGRVVHTCKKSGKKMFLAGTDENKLVRIEAGDDISRFEESLEGEIVVATGKLTAFTLETDHDHAEGGDHNCTTEDKSKDYKMICSSFSVSQE